MIVGFDFDNTIIDYTESFIGLAKKKKLLPPEMNKDKISIRNYLRDRNIENEWTLLQGEVYGKNIMSAQIYKGLLEIFEYLSRKNFKIKIISHKTKFPYLGEKVDLRNAALEWIKKNILKKLPNINLDLLDINFEDTIEKKIKKIKELNCDVYIDDLPEILNLLPNSIKKILFSPKINHDHFHKFHVINSWEDFPRILNLNNE
jgi:hypothetical protein